MTEGMMMYELHLPLVMLANRALQRGPSAGVSPEQIKADLKVNFCYYEFESMAFVET